MFTYAYGFPRLGMLKEYKKYTEQFWRGEISEEDFISRMEEIESGRMSLYKASVDYFPIGEFTYYDNILDTAFMFGVYKFSGLKDYYEYARGKGALKLKKYFNTNYHYLVPHIGRKAGFKLLWNKPLSYFNTFFSFKDNPVFCIGPYTFLKLSNLEAGFEESLAKLCDMYRILFNKLYANGVRYLHLEEPAFVLDTAPGEVKMIKKYYLNMLKSKINVNLFTYYESVPFLNKIYDLPLSGIGLDFVSTDENMHTIKKYGFPKDKTLFLGIINGRNPRRANVLSKAEMADGIIKSLHMDYSKAVLSTSCPLFHLPITLENEHTMKESIKNKLSFAKEKLYELYLTKKVLEGDTKEAKKWSRGIETEKIPAFSKKFDTLSLSKEEFVKRRRLHDELYKLPLFPTTTIGSFPQDSELRKMRLDFRRKRISAKEYNKYIRDKIKNVIAVQEKYGLDVLVHGEFERTDMVEFFAQKLDGFATTDNGWIISYGTRVYRPPIIYTSIKRSRPITIKELSYAQRIAHKPVKGILTGPVTIIAWSYNLRNDPVYKVAFELSRALNKEASELVKNNINFIQIDEPAIKEYAPLRKKKNDFYFSWAIRAFNITAKLPKKVQVHTHMCYSEFGGIIKWILKMNFDVITIEAAREEANIINSFRNIKMIKQIGPGVWDIHSKYPANRKTMDNVISTAVKMFGKDKVWVNPDCGLKTRGWPEVNVSLERMVEIAKHYREKYA